MGNVHKQLEFCVFVELTTVAAIQKHDLLNRSIAEANGTHSLVKKFLHSIRGLVHGIEDDEVLSTVFEALEPDDCDGVTRTLEVDRGQVCSMDLDGLLFGTAEVCFYFVEKAFMSEAVGLVVDLSDRAWDAQVIEKSLNLLLVSHSSLKESRCLPR